MEVHQDLPASPARAQHREAVVAYRDHMRQSPGGAASARRRRAEDNQLRAGPAVEVCDVDSREDGVAVCAERRGADLVCGGVVISKFFFDVWVSSLTGRLVGGVYPGDGCMGGSYQGVHEGFFGVVVVGLAWVCGHVGHVERLGVAHALDEFFLRDGLSNGSRWLLWRHRCG